MFKWLHVLIDLDKIIKLTHLFIIRFYNFFFFETIIRFYNWNGPIRPNMTEVDQNRLNGLKWTEMLH